MPFVVFAAVLLFYVYRYATFTGSRVGGDGFYSWMFARSMAFDGDLHFANDYAMCGDPWHVGSNEGGGRPANPFYVGPALLWAPVLRVISWIVPLAHNAPASVRNGCAGPWQVGTLAMTPLIAVLLLYLGYRVARRWASERVSLASMLVVALASPLTHFGTLIPSYSHVWAALGVAVFLITWIRAVEEPLSYTRWLACGLGVGFAAMMRSQSVTLLFAPALVLAVRIVDDVREKRAPTRAVLSGLVVLAGFAAIFWIQLAVYKVLYGRYWVVPQGRAYLHLGESHPFLLLFAPRGGFFYWHPLMWLGAIGFAMLLWRRDRRLVAVALLVPFTIDVYVNAAVNDWHGAATFGARRLTTLAAPFVATGAVFLAAAWRWLRASPRRLAVFAATGWLLPWVVINVGASTANYDGRVPYDRAVPMPELYGNGLRYGLDGVYDLVGNPFVLPATIPFALRYGVHPRRFDLVAVDGIFRHSYRPVLLEGTDALEFTDRSIAGLLVDGIEQRGDGILVRAGHQGRMLFTLAWGTVTDIEVEGHTLRADASPAHVMIVNGSFFVRREAGVITVRPIGGVLRLSVARDVFDGGINELIFRTDRDVVLRRMRFVDRMVHDSSVR